MGAQVVGLGLPPEEGRPNLFTCAQIEQGLESHLGDIRDQTLVENLLRRFQPDLVFHLAAQPLVRQSYVDPVETYSTNVMGTVSVLEAVRKIPSAKGIVVVTTDKCYENREWLWGYREDEPLGGRDPYSSSKACTEIVTAAYRHSFFAQTDVLVASVRAGNVIGGGDWSKDRLVPDILANLQNNQEVLLRNPDATRPWQHVLEPLLGYLLVGAELLAGNRSIAEAWNFGPTDKDCTTVEDIAKRMVAIWGSGQLRVQRLANAPHEARFLKLDSSKARHGLKWEPRLGLQQALRFTVEWHRQWCQNPSGMREVCLQQIDLYEQLALADYDSLSSSNRTAA